MKPREETLPVPDPMPQDENQNHEPRVKRKKIRRERNQEVGFGENDMAAAGAGLESFYPPAAKPGPHRVSQFMAEHINEHWLRQQEKHRQPAGRAPYQSHPKCVGIPRCADDARQRRCRPDANRQQQDRDDKLHPLEHGRLFAGTGYLSVDLFPDAAFTKLAALMAVVLAGVSPGGWLLQPAHIPAPASPARSAASIHPGSCRHVPRTRWESAIVPRTHFAIRQHIFRC